ncbi:two-component system, OmpR family, sensor kinase [Thermomonospora echinospora]|uniref:histidine kinase n=1 Tax=Thermomonospora echinospora TaxID=1992 RepID=A0A1H6D181_9ACTN|nr:HAMP domain-containing sensor histidine kinase [Thermomonospora echinospora]SEG79139.1 two-component system, OmpR family, sensor kinase [Thermomonospora echinospora]
MIAAPARKPGPLRSLSDRTPLRVKLIAAVLVLVTVGLTVISVAGVGVLRGYLVEQTDEQLRQTATRMAEQLTHPQFDRSGRILLRVPSDVYGQIREPDGTVSSDIQALEASGSPRVPDHLSGHYGEPFTVPGTGPSWRVLAIPLDSGGSVVAGVSLDEVDRTVGRLIVIDLLVGLAVLVVLAGVGVWAVRVSLRPLTAIEETAGAIAAGDLSRRVPHADPRTEVGRLGGSLNGMLAQIETAFRAREASESTARESERRMRRFVADAGHELRTPLTAIRGFAELYRQGAAGGPAEVDRLIGRIENAAARMGLLVEDLLLLARLDRQRPLDRRPVDLLAVAAESVQEARVVAPDREIDLAVEGGMAYQVLGDEARLRQVLGNLLGNAVQHTPSGTPVQVRLRPGTPAEVRALQQRGAPPGIPTVVCEVADTGPGLTPEQAERVFERFYRADESRNRQDGGTGLGLAIVAALTAAHGGAVQVETAPGQGAVFRVVLPLAPD